MANINPGSGAPLNYMEINSRVSPWHPSTVHVSGSGLSRFFQRYLLQQAQSVFKWTIPDNWDMDYFLNVLYVWGYGAVVKTDKFGVIFQGCGLRGYDIYYQPTHAIITNPLLTGILEPRIHEECEIIKLQPDHGGIYDLVSYYGDLMALTAESLGVNLLNSKFSYVFGATNKAGAESLKKLYDNIASGEPAVFADKQLFGPDGKLAVNLLTQNVAQNYIGDKLLEAIRKIEIEFFSRIGIPSANTDKKERLITDEVNANNVETYALTSIWMDTLNDCIKRVNNMFDLNISVEFRQNGGEINGDFVNPGISEGRRKSI